MALFGNNRNNNNNYQQQERVNTTTYVTRLYTGSDDARALSLNYWNDRVIISIAQQLADNSNGIRFDYNNSLSSIINNQSIYTLKQGIDLLEEDPEIPSISLISGNDLIKIGRGSEYGYTESPYYLAIFTYNDGNIVNQDIFNFSEVVIDDQTLVIGFDENNPRGTYEEIRYNVNWGIFKQFINHSVETMISGGVQSANSRMNVSFTRLSQELSAMTTLVNNMLVAFNNSSSQGNSNASGNRFGSSTGSSPRGNGFAARGNGLGRTPSNGGAPIGGFGRQSMNKLPTSVQKEVSTTDDIEDIEDMDEM